MKVLVVYCHPNPKSFNHAILETVTGELSSRNIEYRVADLYQMGWNPVLSKAELESRSEGKPSLDVANQQQDVKWADCLVFIYPIWWEDRPALLKGWFDRVFTQGFAYNITERGIEGLLKGKKALVVTTFDSDEQTHKSTGMLSAIETIIAAGNLKFSGFTDVTHKSCFAVSMVSDSERKKELQEIAGLVNQIVV